MLAGFIVLYVAIAVAFLAITSIFMGDAEVPKGNLDNLGDLDNWKYWSGIRKNFDGDLNSEEYRDICNYERDAARWYIKNAAAILGIIFWPVSIVYWVGIILYRLGIVLFTFLSNIPGVIRSAKGY